MKRSLVLCSLFLSHCLLNSLQGGEISCGKSPRPSRVTVRHIEANGIGYNQGYSTLEGFFSPNNPYRTSWIPFLDLRGHVFNTGRFAANAGVGLRYLTSSRVWGANAYYDYRNTHHQHYNQVALGLETLGEVWDARINGYLPVGRKTSSLYHLKFSHFEEHNAILSQKQQVALKGVNAEVGGHVNRYKHFPLYFTAGPYYLGARGINAWGGQVRAVCDIYEYFRLEGNVSYDNQFRWRGQGQASVIIPFGPRRAIRAAADFCDQAIALSERAVQRVDRFEIIPVKSHRVKSVAIDPLTNLPWVFWFVDNTSSSDGTFESPFPTLAQAQNASAAYNAIYVFPGDGTANGMNAGITLKNHQRLLGSSVEHLLPTTKGFVTIPSMAASLPNITNTASDVVTLANSNLVSGFIITAAVADKSGLAGTDIENLFAFQNQFATLDITTNGIGLLNPSGIVLVGDSTFKGFNGNDATVNGNGIYVELDSGNSLKTLSVFGSAFSDMNNLDGGTGGNGISVNLVGGSLGSLNVASSTFNEVNGPGNIFASLSGGATLDTYNVASCSFSNIQGNSAIQAALSGSSTLNNLNVAGCSFVDLSGATGIYLPLSGNSVVSNVNTSSNTITNLVFSFGFVWAKLTNNATLSNINASSCTFVGLNDTFVFFGDLHNNSTLTNFNVSSCSFDIIDEDGAGVIVELSDSSTVSNLNVSSCNFNGLFNGGEGIELGIGSGTLHNFNASSCNFSGLDGSAIGIGAFVTGGTLNNANVSSCSFDDMNNSFGIQIQADTTLGNFNVSSCSFTNINQNEGILIDIFGGTFSSFSADSCSFSGLNQSNAVNLNFTSGTLSAFTISDTVFNDVVSSPSATPGALYLDMNSSTSTNLQLLSNTFHGDSSSPTGWAATVNVQGGTTCLEFLDNSATAAYNPVPYFFEQSGGTFNRTVGSDSTTNTGQITTMGTVGAPGTCTQ